MRQLNHVGPSPPGSALTLILLVFELLGRAVAAFAGPRLHSWDEACLLAELGSSFTCE